MACPLAAASEAATDAGVAALRSALHDALDARGASLEGEFSLEAGPLPPDALGELDQRLVALSQEAGPLRAALARIGFRLVHRRAWERIGYARLSDYAAERLGLAARSLRSLAEVASRFDDSPALESALLTGTLGWTKTRLLARLPHTEDEDAWIAYARTLTAHELSRAVRKVDLGSIEARGADERLARGRSFHVRCTPQVRWKWHLARHTARRVAGRVLHQSEAAELIAAEVLSALPIDERAEAEALACEEAGASWCCEQEAAGGEGEAGETAGGAGETTGGKEEARSSGTTSEATRPPWRSLGVPPRHAPFTWGPRDPTTRPAYPPALEALLEGLGEADAFELDRRLRHALSLEQRLEARLSPVLAAVWSRFVHRALGFPTREAYARERLNMDPSRARALVRLERLALHSEPFARAYRSGRLSWVKAGVLEPLVLADPLGCFVEEWVSWAERVTVRRLREDVEHALTLAETDPGAFRRTGGLPREARGGGRGDSDGPSGGDREIGAASTDPDDTMVAGTDLEEGDADHRTKGTGQPGGGDREIGASRYRGVPLAAWNHPEPLKSVPEETCWATFGGPAEVVQLFRALVCTLRRRLEKETGRLPTPGQALDVMLDHVLQTWGALDEKVAARHQVFARDGWRCAVPGCTSMQNLHDHHVRFRSAGGGNEMENRVTLCAFHHLRGVHAGLLRCVGRAPDGLRWEIGIRPGWTPLIVYRSGDVRVPAETMLATS